MMRKAQEHQPVTSLSAGGGVFGLSWLGTARQQGGCTSSIVGRCCCAPGQKIWLGLWGNVYARGVLTVSRCFVVLSP